MSAINEPLTAYRPFKVAVSDEMLADIRRRVENFPWHEMPDDGGWDY
ncbi:MAG: epoxide hydrolase, partial [Rhizobiales bacterium]|nr:epoxide hydrolase [Hyphomicrobiales bacterium]